MMIETKINKKGAMALGQIMILLIGVIAISWAVGGGIGVVRAENKGGGDSTSYKSCSGTCRSSCLSGETTKTLVTGCLGSTPKCCISSGLTKKEPPAPGSGTPQQRESAPPEYDWGTYNYYADMDRDGVADTGVPNQYINNDDPNNPKIEPGFWDWATRIGGLAGTGTAIITFADKAGNKLGGEVGKETLKNMPKSDFLPNLKNWFLKGGKGLWQGAGTILMAWLAYALVKSVTASMMHERNANPINTAAFWTTIGVSGWGVAAMLGATGPPGWAAAAIVIIAALVTGIITGQRFSQETFSYIVSTWQPVDKGKWCEKCDELEYGCSEYQCKIFGKACGLLNPGTDYQKCYWKSEGDTTPPIISLIEEKISDKLKYEEFEITSPPERGVRIINTKTEDPKKCVPAFTSLEIKVQTDEYALCMIDTKRKESMEQMTKLMDEGNYLTLNHTLFIPSSATASLEQLENMGYVLEEGRDYGFFIKCKDDNGNENPLHFLVEFCIDDGPDTNAPIITGTSKEQKDFIKFNETETPLTVYLNEPATCKWDFEDKEYNLMGYNFGSCSSPESLTYWCSGNLTGLKNDQENKFYIRCKDKPWWTEKDYEEKNVKQFANEESYPFALKGTRSLYIDKITINREESGAKIKDSANPTKVTIEVKTSAGAEEGVSTCSYLTSRESWSEFSNGGTFEPSYKNFESFWLSAGTYKREIKCSDAAGNSDTAEINFTIETDREAPIIVRAFREGTSYLKVITDEEAECVYSLNNCNYEFEDGIEMMTNDNLEHFEDWNTNLEYSIKCKDEYGNQPEPNQCNMVVRASDF